MATTKGRKTPEAPVGIDPYDDDEDEEEAADSRAAWLRSRWTIKERMQLQELAMKIVKQICYEAQTSIDQSLANKGGQLARVDALIIAMGGKGLFDEKKVQQ